MWNIIWCQDWIWFCKLVYLVKDIITSSLSPKGSQKVTALPYKSTPHCSPTSQLLQFDLKNKKIELP